MARYDCRKLPPLKAVAVLGVDFMSENVRAILDEAGHTDVQVSFMCIMHPVLGAQRPDMTAANCNPWKQALEAALALAIAASLSTKEVAQRAQQHQHDLCDL